MAEISERQNDQTPTNHLITQASLIFKSDQDITQILNKGHNTFESNPELTGNQDILQILDSRLYMREPTPPIKQQEPKLLTVEDKFKILFGDKF